MGRLNRLLHTAVQREEDMVVLSVLEDKLKQARVVHSRDVPEDVVTMNSCVRPLYSDPLEESECWFRFPENVSVASRDMSILTGPSVALLGSKEGESIEWTSESGVRKCRIVELVYQPERLGNFER